MAINNPTESIEMAQVPEKAKSDFDLGALVRSPAFQIAALLLTALVLVFWPLMQKLPDLWFATETYYAHGALVPLCAAFVIYDRWAKLREIPVKGSWFALIPLLTLLYVTWVASRVMMPLLLSVLFVFCMLACIWVIAGGRWMLALSPMVLYLLFGLPVFDRFVDRMTFPLQMVSADTAFYMLKALGLEPHRMEPTVVALPEFVLNIAAACSGLKLTLAVIAITAFFILVARLNIWANLVLATIAIPISVIVNGFRITAIGLVGNTWGEDAGIQFHDYSGYIALVLCFIILFSITRALGWKSQ